MDQEEVNAVPATAMDVGAVAGAVAPPSDVKKKRKRSLDVVGQTNVPEAASTSSAAAAAPSGQPPPLIGKSGGDAIRHGIVQTQPAEFIATFQKEHGIRGVPGIESSLAFLDLFAPKRSTIYTSVLGDLSQQLTQRIAAGQVTQERMVQLLEASFAYIRVDELAPIPIALLLALCRTSALPTRYVKALVGSPERFIEGLPLELRRRLMEAEPDKLFWHAEQMRSFLLGYADDATRIDDYSSLLPTEHVAPSLRKVRSAIPSASSISLSSSASTASPSALALNSILEWIGSSTRLYKAFCNRLRDLCTSADAVGQSSVVWRALRVDLIMRLHDLESTTSSSSAFSIDSSTGPATPATALSAAAVDPLHKWCWCLDAAAKTPVFESKLLETIVGGDFEQGEAGFLPGLHTKSHTLHDLALLAGHPFTIGALLRAVQAALLQVVETESTPKDHPQLTPLTRILHLALSDSASLVAASATVSAAGHSGLSLPDFVGISELFDEFYPFICELVIYSQLGEMEPLNSKLIEYVHMVPLARAVYLHYLLTRIAAHDVQQTSAILASLPAIQEDGVSAWTTASRAGEQNLLHGLLQTATTLLIGMKDAAGADAASDPTFRAVLFTGCFIPLAALSPYAHKQCVRLIIAFHECMPADELARYVLQVQRHGHAGADAPLSTGDGAMSDDTATPTPPPFIKPTSTIQAQLAILYDQLKTLKPHLFEQA